MNIFDVCQLGRDEIRNCSVLAWFLDECGSHGLGSAFLSTVLERCGPGSIAGEKLVGGYASRTEYCPNGEQTNRLDIVCGGDDFLIYFEVKIDSHEHTYQTGRYYARLHNNIGKRGGAADIYISMRASLKPEGPLFELVRLRAYSGWSGIRKYGAANSGMHITACLK